MNPTDFTYSSNELSKGEFIYGAPAKCRAQVYKVIGNATRLISGYGFFFQDALQNVMNASVPK